MILPSHRDVRVARLELALSQAEAAQIVGVPESTWQRSETDPIMSSYAQIRFVSWERFLIETHKLRPADSRWRVREAYLRQMGY